MISALILCIFTVPILIGIIQPMTSERIHRSFSSLLNSVVLLASIILAIYLSGLILSSDALMTSLYSRFPALESFVENQGIWAYAILIFALLLILNALLFLLLTPVYRYVFRPMSDGIASGLSRVNGFVRRIVGGLWKLPQSVWLVLVFALLLSFSTGFFNSTFITEEANTSAPYQLVQQRVIQPLLKSDAIRDIRVILNNSFQLADDGSPEFADQYLIKYFNGVPLSEAIQSNSEIDTKAMDIVGSESSDRQKAYLIYLWICENVSYDNDKAASISANPFGVSSGAVVAYTTRTGICFDFACLYVAMCRAVDVKVRFVTGLGYTGAEWGDHAWNQAYDADASEWLSVDTTFGTSGVNYFDSAHFNLDHKDSIVQGEW